MTMKYKDIYNNSIQKKEEFWQEHATKIDWNKDFAKVLDSSQAPFYRWFKGGKTNVCYNAVDKHVENGYGEQPAIIYHSQMSGQRQKISYKELKTQIAKCAGLLQAKGVGKGDRVVIYMPMIPEAIVAMLACARIGAIHVVIFGGFAANELATRLIDTNPKIIITASCGLEPQKVVNYQQIIEKALTIFTGNSIKNILVFARKEEPWQFNPTRDLLWQDVVEKATPVACLPVESEHPLYILYTSGTTGKPKGVTRDTAGYMVALKYSMDYIYNIKEGETWWSASDIGWVVGHSYIVYAPLLQRCTTIVFEGKPVGTPDASVFWQVINDYDVVAMFTAPTAIRAIKRVDGEGKLAKQFPMNKFRALYLAGERCDSDTLRWSQKILNAEVIDNWWQTETGWPVVSNPLGIEKLEIKEGSATVPMPGYDVQILDNDGKQIAANKMGNICIKLPLPPGTLLTLWNSNEDCINSYFKNFNGYYQTGDAGYKDEDNYIFIISRTDDIINIAGHRLSTGAIEEVVSQHQDIAECAVIGAKHSIKGEIPFGFLILKENVTRDRQEITQEIVELVREKIGPVATFKELLFINRLPKTRSGKILRKILRAIINKEEYKFPSTIEDASVLAYLHQLLNNQTDKNFIDTEPFMGWLIEKTVEVSCSLKEITCLPKIGIEIEVFYSTINYKDALALQDKAPIAKSFPMVPGIDLAGKVIASDNQQFQVGNEVFCNGWGVGEKYWGGLAQKAKIPAEYLQLIPAKMNAQSCMALGTAGYTAMLCVLALLDNEIAPTSGKVVISGASGGVGSFALLFLAKLGFEIVTITGKEDQVEKLYQQGASEVLLRKNFEISAKALDKAIWLAAIDTVGGNVLANILSKIKDNGVVSLCGLTGGSELKTTVMPFILRGVKMIGINSVTQPMKNRKRVWDKIAELISIDECEKLCDVIELKDAQTKADELLQGTLSKRVIVKI